MKRPAIRAYMGDWVYYISSLTFEQVDTYVKRVDDELHKSKTLNDLIQRSITNNFLSIKDYLLNQKERFFTALVLAVYDGEPNWIEVELEYNDEEFFNLGFLDFKGDEKIFPVDGQHRVEGIKAALVKNEELSSEMVSVIFIAHKKSEEGMQRSRRLFSTLNRYAKPVTMDDIIALDEDDILAIVTRRLLEEFDLFSGERITKSKNKAIPDTDKSSITSIITLYQCNNELLKLFRRYRKLEAPNSKRDRLKLEEYLKFRPPEEEIILFYDFCHNFWSKFQEKIEDVRTFAENTDKNPAQEYRNNQSGGNLLFRPVGLLPFIKACIDINRKRENSFEDIFSHFDQMNFNINTVPWKNVLWNPIEKTMIMGTQTVVKLLLLYKYDSTILTSSEMKSFKEKYASLNSIDEKLMDNALVNISRQ